MDYFTLPLTTVAYHDPKTGFKTVAKNIKAANGIVAEKPGNHIFVSGIIGGVYTLSPHSRFPRLEGLILVLGNAGI